MVKHGNAGVSGDSEREFAEAINRFRGLLDPVAIERLQPLGPAAVYTTLVTVWLLVYQRLHAGKTLNEAVTNFMASNPEELSDNRRVRDRTLSANTAAYSRARTRLLPKVTDHVANHIFESLMHTTPPSLAGRRVFLLDGTTIALAPTKALRAAYPPARNQHGESVWPIAHLLVAHELESGCALLPEVGAMYGEEAVSEVELAKRIMSRLPLRSLLMADRNFGVFAVAHAAVQAGHETLFRLTRSRFQALLRHATPLPPRHTDHLGTQGSKRRRWKLDWRPSKADRASHPELSADAHVEVHLHEIVLSNTLTLWLVTTLNVESAVLADLYKRRQDIETDIRDVKVTLQTEKVRAKSVAMLQKELATSIIAYNLVQQVRRLAAQQVGVQPRRLSFTGVWAAVRIILLESHQWIDLTPAQWHAKFQLTLNIAQQKKLPIRPHRSYPRQALPKRSKSTSGTRKTKPNATK